MMSEIMEAINRAAITKIFLEHGWMVYKPEADIGGVDFLVMNLETEEVRKIQLKSRWTVDRKYQNKKVWMCFPNGAHWYLCEHDKMVEHGLSLGWQLWKTENGEPRPSYSTVTVSKDMAKKMSEYQFPVALKAAS